MLADSTLADFDFEGAGGIPLVDGKLAPLIGKSGLGDIDRASSEDFDGSEIWAGAKGDEHLGDRGVGGFGEGKALGIIEAKGAEGDLPFPGTDLGFEAAGVVDGYGNGAFDAGEFPAFGQDGAEIFLATFSGDGQFQFHAQPEGDSVFEGGGEFDIEKGFIGIFGGAGAFQPEDALFVPGG